MSINNERRKHAPDNNPQRIATYNMVPGTVVRLRNHIFVLVDASKGIHAKTGTVGGWEAVRVVGNGDRSELVTIERSRA